MNARDEAGSADGALFSDDELARVTLNRDGFFSDDQSAEASGALDARLARSLAPHEGDPRARAMAINALHAQMSDDTRAALKWSAALIDANRATLREDSARSGWLDNRPIIAGLDHAAGKGGLDFSSMNFNWLESYPDPPWLDYPFNDGVSRFSSDRTRALSHYPAPPGQAPSRTDRLA
ncbi:hypothetical protein [Sphingomonas quercus]|uniref:Uncharacterized protein n=1 Tax=Sphingomonas quercus TaxID=2842451 RepID=A0ABS6BL39_9SPHN|nr:hypothetical protein [Sphingomonas quercus]MBU3079019.1 hypothetical protein [Sphingomonas quercus]